MCAIRYRHILVSSTTSLPKREGSIEPREDTRDASTVASTNANSTASTAPRKPYRGRNLPDSAHKESLKMRFKTAVRSEKHNECGEEDYDKRSAVCDYLREPALLSLFRKHLRTVFSPRPVIPFIFSVKVVMLTLYLSVWNKQLRAYPRQVCRGCKIVMFNTSLMKLQRFVTHLNLRFQEDIAHLVRIAAAACGVYAYAMNDTANVTSPITDLTSPLPLAPYYYHGGEQYYRIDC